MIVMEKLTKTNQVNGNLITLIELLIKWTGGGRGVKAQNDATLLQVITRSTRTIRQSISHPLPLLLLYSGWSSEQRRSRDGCDLSLD